VSLAEQVLTHCPARVEGVELAPGGGGVFEVSRDGRLVFSKKAVGRFPSWDELRPLLD